MTQERGFHIKLRNWTILVELLQSTVKCKQIYENRKTDLKKRILLILFEFVGTKNLQTTLSFFSSETSIIALKEGKNIFNNDCL
jgi:hypothetical protein